VNEKCWAEVVVAEERLAVSERENKNSNLADQDEQIHRLAVNARETKNSNLAEQDEQIRRLVVSEREIQKQNLCLRVSSEPPEQAETDRINNRKEVALSVLTIGRDGVRWDNEIQRKKKEPHKEKLEQNLDLKTRVIFFLTCVTPPKWLSEGVVDSQRLHAVKRKTDCQNKSQRKVLHLS